MALNATRNSNGPRIDLLDNAILQPIIQYEVQSSEHFTYPNTPWSQHVQITDFLLYLIKKIFFIEAALEPLVQQRHTKQPYEGQDLIKAWLAHLALVCLQSTPLV